MLKLALALVVLAVFVSLHLYAHAFFEVFHSWLGVCIAGFEGHQLITHVTKVKQTKKRR